MLAVENEEKVDTTIFATTDVPIESAAVDELLQMLELQGTAERFAEVAPEKFSVPPTIEKVAVTPDFHKAKGIPVGTVLATRGFLVPQAIGSDINCGMRLHTTALKVDVVKGNLDALEERFRHIFFAGGRNLPMTRVQREALLREGLSGLLNTTPSSCLEGLWRYFHESRIDRHLGRVDGQGGLPARGTAGLESYLGTEERAVRDQVTGCIGGGNHFVEVQYVEKIFDGAAAHAWGLQQGMITIMVHTGSVAVGHLAGERYRAQVRAMHPATQPHPKNGIFILPTGEEGGAEVQAFWDSLHNAANFAFANRCFLALMAWAGMREVLGDFDLPLLYDAPHNLLWRESESPDARVIHRKGACPARGYEAMAGTEFECYGEPVLVPGSMGASSFVLAGQGLEASLHSASHGAGRVLSRGDAAHGFDAEFERFMKEFRVVTPVDLRRPDIALRRDIVDKKLQALKEEAPYAYKGIAPIISTLEKAGIARVVAELRPLMTMKG
jgi:tRNA-splicing ligase RtcB